MELKFKEFEKRLEKACGNVHRDFSKKYNSDIYLSAGGSKLEAFISDLQQELEITATTFLKENNLEKDAEARKRVFTMIKFQAKRCVESFSRI
ncbi:hypothetical protein AM493_19205 [Flavobacterium akiainvivens]|uniref:Uncharacterized protein n=1 Tax=Flavobacterium akiainvivens TaxID=1202724 RepID=A0A0M8MDI9_9FLAO|nr:hypothetical protein [Flavobacterium akiainvivens]KOS07945.1 hypothetical protein AM493_19205 [Flavobacterium akiainvivens]SFQ29422.1 hypothetical protein SAMN05444144_102423 [Flavobacterium akiainvivens]